MRPASFISHFKRAVSVLLLLALVLGGVAFFGRALAKTDGLRKNGPYLADDRQYDVLFFGSSHVVNGVLPMQLWQDYGLTSYNLGGHGASVAASYWQLRLATRVRKPKVAVLDVMFAGADSTEMSLGLAHELLDFQPLSALKVRAVCDLYADPGDRAELLFPLDVYHNRWKELNSDMVREGLGEGAAASTEKGAQLREKTHPMEPRALIPETEVRTQAAVGLTYVEKFVDYCRESGIEPVLTFLPSHLPEQMQLDCNAAMALGERLGVTVLNMQYTDLVDDAIDWADDGGHLNASGARKTTACLGAFLREQCGLEDHRGDGAYAQWDRDYEDYVTFLTTEMWFVDNADGILTLAATGLFSLEAAISPDFTDETVLRQLESLGVTPAALAPGGNLSLTVRDSQGNVLQQATFTQGGSLEAEDN